MDLNNVNQSACGLSFQIQNAATLESLQELILKHSTLLQTAGCFRRVNNSVEKHMIVEEYVRWYVIDRNHSVIKR